MAISVSFSLESSCLCAMRKHFAAYSRYRAANSPAFIPNPGSALRRNTCCNAAAEGSFLCRAPPTQIQPPVGRKIGQLSREPGEWRPPRRRKDQSLCEKRPPNAAAFRNIPEAGVDTHQLQPTVAVPRERMLLDKVERLIREAPGLTATELARRLFGVNAYHSQVSTECRVLAHFKRIERRGSGGPGDPFRYFPAKSDG